MKEHFIQLFKKHRLIVLILIVIILFIFIGYTLINNNDGGGAPAIEGVPVNASIIIETNNLEDIIKNLKNENPMWQSIKNVPYLKTLNTELRFLDSLIKNNRQFRKVLSDKRFIISVHLQGKNNIEFLYLTTVGGTSEQKRTKEAVEKLLEGNGTIERRTYEKTSIYDISLNEKFKKYGLTNCSLSFAEGIMAFSFSPILVENAVRQIIQKNSLTNDENFRQITKAAGKSTLANIYINYKQLPKLILPFFNSQYASQISYLTNMAYWSAFDVTLNDTEILLNGFSYCNKSDDKYLNLFLEQPAVKTGIEEIIPNKTTSFGIFSINSLTKFKKNYYNYLKENDWLSEQNAQMSKIKREFNFDAENFVFEMLEREIGIVTVDFTRQATDYQSFIVAKTKNAKDARPVLWEMVKNYAKKTNTDLKKISIPFNTDNNEYSITLMPPSNLFGQVMGSYFAGDYGWYTFIGNYFVAGPTPSALEDFIKSYDLNQTLSNDQFYKQFSESLSPSGIYFYYNIPQSSGLTGLILNESLAKTYQKYKKSYSNFQAAALQLSANNEHIYTSLYLLYNPEIHTRSHTLWETKLDTTAIIKPQIVTNHNDNSKEIFVQDNSQKIYVIDATGRFIFKKQINQTINSDVYQIDYLKNNKLQYLFSTPDAIHLIDRNGNYVSPYPIKLKSEATAGLAVFDYDNNRDYRIFIPCKDKQMYVYTKEGKLLNGWSFDKTESNVYVPVQYLSYQDKDYILFSDKLNTYILNRKGDIRIKLTENFTRSRNRFFFEPEHGAIRDRFVTTSNSGEVYYIYFDGSVKQETIENYSPDHYFEYADINGDDKRDYIFFDKNKLEAYTSDKKKIFSREFDDDIVSGLQVFKFSKNNVKIGITDTEQNLIYLFNADGNLYPGFPLQGYTPFSITKFNESGKYNLIVGSKDNFLYNYQIQ